MIRRLRKGNIPLLAAQVWFLGIIGGCANDKPLELTFAKFPSVETDPAVLPTFAVGDSFHFSNPDEVWTVRTIDKSLVSWRSSRGAEKVTAFDPFLPPLQWSMENGNSGIERLIVWDKSLFPLQVGKKIKFQSAHHPAGQPNATKFLWKCYVGNSRTVTVKAGTFPAYPVFCRRSDDLTAKYFYAQEINSPLLITTRKRPAPATTRELVRVTLSDGKRIAAAAVPGLPIGWAQVSTPVETRNRTLASNGLATTVPAPTAERGGALRTSANGAPEPSAANSTYVVPQDTEKRSNARLENKGSAEGISGKREPTTTTSTSASKVAVAPRINAPFKIRRTVERTEPSGSKPVPSPSKVPKIKVPILSLQNATIQTASTSRQTPASKPAITFAKPVAPKLSTDGTRIFGVQIASFQHADNAARGWSALSKRLRPLLDNVSHTVVRVNLGPANKVFHRLIAGPFPTRTRADTLCQAIRSRAADCFVKVIPN